MLQGEVYIAQGEPIIAAAVIETSTRWIRTAQSFGILWASSAIQVALVGRVTPYTHALLVAKSSCGRLGTLLLHEAECCPALHVHFIPEPMLNTTFTALAAL